MQKDIGQKEIYSLLNWQDLVELRLFLFNLCLDKLTSINWSPRQFFSSCMTQDCTQQCYTAGIPQEEQQPEEQDCSFIVLLGNSFFVSIIHAASSYDWIPW